MSGHRLRLLGEVTWDGNPVPGARTHALLRSLADAKGRPVSEQRLASEIWGDDPPANPAKALHVVVSRARQATSAESVVRTDHGYRLALDATDVDIWAGDAVLALARRAVAEHDWSAAAADLPTITEHDPVLAGRVLSALGRHADALALLENCGDDDAAFTALLRSEAAVRGVPAALDRFEGYRARLADRLGVDPSSELRELHKELLARDRPVRSGVRADAADLIGRSYDVEQLTALISSDRVVSIVGPGGLGKTRLAHLLGQLSDLPVVHFAELAGVTSPDDLVGELGSILGVRDSVSGAARSLTPEQRADIRARIAQHLEQAPTLLILDNCEHIVAAVAGLVAFFAATVPGLRVLTTTRAPLAISAERVYQLGQLDITDGAELFRRRATAARPAASLPGDTVAEIVERLDGLPLAIELAAVKVRAMSVADISHRLSNRFALLRGGDRSAPDRHQTLLAVIDWSWNLLAEPERRALRRLAVFHDGFTIEAADVVAGDDALSSVSELVDQSLLTVLESPNGVRYRMLETVREFGRMQLVDAGDESDAKAAQRRWATQFAATHARLLISPQQIATVDAVRAEEMNLADVLRQALGDSDRETVVALAAVLGGFWTISGDQPRMFTLTAPLTAALADWTPPAHLLERTRFVLGLTLFGAGLGTRSEPGSDAERLQAALARVGTDSADPRLRALLRVFAGLTDSARAEEVVAELTNDPDPRVRAVGLQFRSFERENVGDPEAALEAGTTALVLVESQLAVDGPWNLATLHTQLSGLCAQFGQVPAAGQHAAASIPVLDRLGANDDALQMRSILAMTALEEGRIDDAERIIEDSVSIVHRGGFGAQGAVLTSRAHLAFARGKTDSGLALLRRSVAAMRDLKFPGLGAEGYAPWVIFAESNALAAYARYADGDDGRDLYEVLRSKVGTVLDPDRRFLDYPVAGLHLVGLGIWGLLRKALPPKDSVRLLVIAERFAYHRFSPPLRWDRIAEDAERLAPGVLAAISAEYGDRRGPDLLDEARAAIAHIFRE